MYFHVQPRASWATFITSHGHPPILFFYNCLVDRIRKTGFSQSQASCDRLALLRHHENADGDHDGDNDEDDADGDEDDSDDGDDCDDDDDDDDGFLSMR